MVINDEVSKEIKGHKDILAINIYRFNGVTIPVDADIDEDEMILKIATELKSRYKFFKVAQKDNKNSDVFLAETVIANLNAITIVDPTDLLPTETIQIQIEIGKILEEEGFNEKGEDEIEEFGAESEKTLTDVGVDMIDVLGEDAEVVAQVETTEKIVTIEEVIAEEKAAEEAGFEIPATIEEAEKILANDLAKALNLPK